MCLPWVSVEQFAGVCVIAGSISRPLLAQDLIFCRHPPALKLRQRALGEESRRYYVAP
jgi:hypothetical protein